MKLSTELSRNGGIGRVQDLVDQGITRYTLKKLVERGDIVRPFRGWIALPNTDPALVFAARHHVVLTCVTQAKRLGLWVPFPAERWHAAAPGRGASSDASHMRVHWARPLVPRRPYQLEDPIENVLTYVSECQSREAATVIWESALNQKKIEYRQLMTLPLDRRARAILAQCTPFSDSGLETLVRSRLRWMRLPLRQQIMVDGRPVDLLIGERLVVQLDGATHTGAQRTADIAHDARLIALGYRVIRFSYDQVMFRWEEAQWIIQAAVSRGEHLPE